MNWYIFLLFFFILRFFLSLNFISLHILIWIGSEKKILFTKIFNIKTFFFLTDTSKTDLSITVFPRHFEMRNNYCYLYFSLYKNNSKNKNEKKRFNSIFDYKNNNIWLEKLLIRAAACFLRKILSWQSVFYMIFEKKKRGHSILCQWFNFWEEKRYFSFEKTNYFLYCFWSLPNW